MPSHSRLPKFFRSPSWTIKMPAPLMPCCSARPVKFDDGSSSPLKKTILGLSRVPRFSVWFVPHPLVSVGVLVDPDEAPVRTIGHAIVLCSTVVDGLLATRLMNWSIVVGFSELSEATVAVPVAYVPLVFLPLMLACLAAVL